MGWYRHVCVCIADSNTGVFVWTPSGDYYFHNQSSYLKFYARDSSGGVALYWPSLRLCTCSEGASPCSFSAIPGEPFSNGMSGGTIVNIGWKLTLLLSIGDRCFDQGQLALQIVLIYGKQTHWYTCDSRLCNSHASVHLSMCMPLTWNHILQQPCGQFLSLASC